MSSHEFTKVPHEIIDALNEFLADLTLVYFKTHVFHWNVEGPQFYSLHSMFEKFYQELWESIDEIAERIRALGEKTPSSYKSLFENATIEEAGASPASHIMVRILREDYLTLARKAHDVGSIADAQEDRVTTDMMTEKATFLEKAAWMLASSLGD